MRYDAILIDADETLFDFAQAERLAIEETLAALGICDASAAGVYREINENCWKAFERGEITQARLKLRRFEELFERFPSDASAQEASDLYIAALAAKPHLLPGALHVMEEIARHRPVALVTNGIAKVQRGRIALSPIAPLVSAVVISEEVGDPKPHPAMFREALRLLNVSDPRRALMIGDSLTSDMAGALASGVATCWYNPERLNPPKGMAFDHIATEISEFPQYALM